MIDGHIVICDCGMANYISLEQILSYFKVKCRNCGELVDVPDEPKVEDEYRRDEASEVLADMRRSGKFKARDSRIVSLEKIASGLSEKSVSDVIGR